MKKILICFLMLTIAAPAFADLLLPREQEEEMKIKFEQEREKAQCPPDKPLYLGTCYSCDDPRALPNNKYGSCSETCPNRIVRYECMPKCILKEAPGEGYVYRQCVGWEKKVEVQP
ncbi:MAG: hypothetical protein J6Y91_04300 [Alphaproteobacteria bacterium]|nr:hypothetical protein [Alphaproteobacteria bacterium]